jgi:hypothetical protein
MAFWNEAGVEPKRKFKFLLRFGAASDALPSFIVKKVNKPEVTISEASHKFLGHTFYFPAQTTWNEINATVIDPAGSGGAGDALSETVSANTTDVAEGLYKVLLASGYQSPTNVGTALAGGSAAGTLRTFAKSPSTVQFDQIEIVQIDANGNALETWTLNNAWIKKIAFGELDYSSDDINEVTLTIRYDWADLKTTRGTGASTFDSLLES